MSPTDPLRGFALAVGVLPAAIVGVLPTRRARLAIVVLGACVGVPILLGGVLSGVPVLAVAAIVGLGAASALLAASFRLGTLAMNLSLPTVGVGLSYPDVPPRRRRRHRRPDRLPARPRPRGLGLRRRTPRDAARR